MIEFANISVTLGRFQLRDISFSIPSGHYGVLMGSSGSGKTTLVEILCGLRCQDHGQIFLQGADHSNSPPAARNIGYVPQDGALFPTMNVFANLGFAPALRKIPAARRRQMILDMAASLGLEKLLTRRVPHLSGGEKQRVALGRALLSQPRILCLDEPLAALDDATHAKMVTLLKEIHRTSQTTVLHITHRVSEACELGNQLFHLRDGRLVRSEHPGTGV